MGTGMRIAVVVHGPEAVDSGLASEVIEKAKLIGKVEARVGGATAVAAVIDARLEDMIATESRELPSVAIRQMSSRADLVILVNCGKDRSSALGFGRLVMIKVLPSSVPILQIDDGMSVVWAGDDSSISDALGLIKGELVDMRGAVLRSSQEARRLSGVRHGEFVWINGNVIGRAVKDDVIISQTTSGELNAEGLRMKPTGVERLGRFDLDTAIIRSGHVRRTISQPRCLRSKGESICLIDHCAEQSVFRCRDAAYAVTVGDDTSKIASALLYRLGVPVIAITDGDEDGISNEELYYPGSYLFRLEPGNDDLVGAVIRRECFKKGERISEPIGIEEMAARVRNACGKKLLWERRF